MKGFYYRFPDDFYACGPIEGTSERNVRAWLREFYGLKRLPRGLEVWEAVPEQDGLSRNYAEYQRDLPAWASGPL